MCSTKLSTPLIRLLSVVCIALLSGSTRAVAQHETVLHSFFDHSPTAGVALDAAGNIYGTTVRGFYELTPNSGGDFRTIYSLIPFDGSTFAPPILDASGNVFGVVTGAFSSYGMVIELIPANDGSWTEKTLYTFPANGKHGLNPYAALTFDKAGNIYGTTANGGAYGEGVVFELLPQVNGSWSQKVLHSFGKGLDGQQPFGGLTIDIDGNLYGTTAYGGSYSSGTAFALMPKTGGGWNERVLHNFGNGEDGQLPFANGGNLVLDTAGNLYGTTYLGGAFSSGTAFELIRLPGGRWKEKILYDFNDGLFPESGLIFDSAGNLYGTTYEGGTVSCGVVIKLLPAGNGTWSEETVYNFFKNSTDDGCTPSGNIVFDASGSLFGTTQQGGLYDSGTVWEITR